MEPRDGGERPARGGGLPLQMLSRQTIHGADSGSIKVHSLSPKVLLSESVAAAHGKFRKAVLRIFKRTNLDIFMCSFLELFSGSANSALSL